MRSSLFKPVYDSYLPIIRQAGGIPRLVRLEPPHWRLTEEVLRSVFNHKTKAVLFNNPLNPAAVVYPREDLELLARFCQEFDTIAICDEVWEHVIFDGREHIPLITIPGMRERTIKVGSAGKIFFADRLEDRLCLRGAAVVARGSQGAPVSYLHHRAPIFRRRSPTASASPRIISIKCARSWRVAATVLNRGTGEYRLPGSSLARHLFPHRRPFPARA